MATATRADAVEDARRYQQAQWIVNRDWLRHSRVPQTWVIDFDQPFLPDYANLFAGTYKSRPCVFKVYWFQCDLARLSALLTAAQAQRCAHLLLPLDWAPIPLDRTTGSATTAILQVLPRLNTCPLSARYTFGNEPTEGLAGLLHDVAAALAALDACGSAHGDISPENVLSDPPRGLAVIDWFPAEAIQGQWSDGYYPLQSNPATMGYLAPRFRPYHEDMDAAPRTIRDDIFSLGVVAYEAATGRHPFSNQRRAKDRAQRSRDRYYTSSQQIIATGIGPHSLADLRPDLPADLTRPIERCLAADEDMRPGLAELLAWRNDCRKS